MFEGLSGATTWSDRQKNHCTVTSDQGLSFDIWLINVTSLMTSEQDCNLLSFLMSFSLFPPTQHPPTTIILVSKWSQESCGSFEMQIKKYVDFRPKNYRSRHCENLKKSQFFPFWKNHKTEVIYPFERNNLFIGKVIDNLETNSRCWWPFRSQNCHQQK